MYTWNTVRGNVESRGMVGLILVRENMLKDVSGLKTVRDMGGRMSDYMVVLHKLKIVSGWFKK